MEQKKEKSPLSNDDMVSLFLGFETLFLIFFVSYGTLLKKWNSTQLTFLDYTVISAFGAFILKTLNWFTMILNFLKIKIKK
jgi:hypothetical protein